MRPLNLSAGVSAIALTMCVAQGARAYAAGEFTPAPGPIEAETLLVVGQREHAMTITPRGLSVSLGEDEFKGVNAFNVEDLGKYAPNFFVRKRFIGDLNGIPGFRGTHSVQSARTLVMIDGFVVSNLLGNGWDFAPKWGIVGPGEVEQFDVVYGPYSSRYAGNAMGGMVNITTRMPEEAEAFATAQRFIQPYEQFGTDKDFSGWTAEGGVGWRQQDGPWSFRLSLRHLRNHSQPMSWYRLTPEQGIGAFAPVSGAVIDPEPRSQMPIFAAEAPAEITQTQTRAKLGYDNGTVRAQALFVYWWAKQEALQPETYLADADGRPVYEGRVAALGRTWIAKGPQARLTSRGEWLGGLRMEAPLGPLSATVNLSTYQVDYSRGRTSSNHAAAVNNGAGTFLAQGPTGWHTGDLTIAYAAGRLEIAAGASANLYETDQIQYSTSHWRTATDRRLTSRTAGKTRHIGSWVEGRLNYEAAAVTAGLRRDDWHAFDGLLSQRSMTGSIASQEYADRRQTAWSPALTGEVALTPDTKAQLSLAIATRFPTVGELFQGSLNGDGSFNPNSYDPNLKAERSRDINLIVARDFGRTKLTGSVFYQRVKNTIFQFQGFNQNGVVTNSYKNIDLTRQWGAEVIIETRDILPGLDIDANAAWIDAETLRNAADPSSEGVAFPRIPRWRLHGNARYAISENVLASLGARYTSRPNSDLRGQQRGDTFGFTSELFALDARIAWTLPHGFRLAAGIDNITNDKAWVFHPYPQRTFLLEAGWKL